MHRPSPEDTAGTNNSGCLRGGEGDQETGARRDLHIAFRAVCGF